MPAAHVAGTTRLVIPSRLPPIQGISGGSTGPFAIVASPFGLVMVSVPAIPAPGGSPPSMAQKITDDNGGGNIISGMSNNTLLIPTVSPSIKVAPAEVTTSSPVPKTPSSPGRSICIPAAPGTVLQTGKAGLLLLLCANALCEAPETPVIRTTITDNKNI